MTRTFTQLVRLVDAKTRPNTMQSRGRRESIQNREGLITATAWPKANLSSSWMGTTILTKSKLPNKDLFHRDQGRSHTHSRTHRTHSTGTSTLLHPTTEDALLKWQVVATTEVAIIKFKVTPARLRHTMVLYDLVLCIFFCDNNSDRKIVIDPSYLMDDPMCCCLQEAMG